MGSYATTEKLDEQEEISFERGNELSGATGSAYQFNEQAAKLVRIKMRYFMVSDSVSSSKMLLPADQRDVALHPVERRYILELDANGKIIGGEWLKIPSTFMGDQEIHPDFFWMAVKAKGWLEDDDDLGGTSDSPFVAYSKVTALLNCANDAASCAPEDVEQPPVVGPSCSDTSGGQATDNGESCWCDAACTKYNDCCGDYQDACVSSPDPDPEPEPSGPSCQNQCGGSSSVNGQKCWCDDQCTGYDDCCADYAVQCG